MDSFDKFSHSEHDGRTWMKNYLSSYFKSKEYLTILDENNLIKKCTSCVINSRSLSYRETHPNVYRF